MNVSPFWSLVINGQDPSSFHPKLHNQPSQELKIWSIYETNSKLLKKIDCFVIQQPRIKLNQYLIMFESMAEGYLIKSSGQITCQGQQMFYELILSNEQYMVKFYDCLGKARLIRPIKLPIENLEVHGIGEYLFCYEAPASASQHGSFYLVRLSNFKSKTQKLICQLLCSSQQKTKIKHLYCNIQTKRIVFSDVEENVYIVIIWQDKFEISHLGKHNQQISVLSMSEQDEVMVVNQNGGMRVWTLDLVQEQVIECKNQPHVISYYRGNGFIAHYTKYREWKIHHHRDEEEPQYNFILINNQGRTSDLDMDKYYYEFSKDSQIIIKSGKNFLLIFNKTQNLILSVYNDFQRVTDIKDKLMSEIQENNFLINFRVDESENILLQIRVFAKFTEKFNLYEYEITNNDGSSHKSYLKRNLSHVYQFNGLVFPIYEREVYKELNQFIISLDQFRSADYKEQENGFRREEEVIDINSYELGVRLLKVSLQFFPSSLDKLVRKIKSNILFNKSICYVQQTYRFFQYCHVILEQFIDPLISIAHSIEKQGFEDIAVLKSKNKDELEKINVIVENMITFLFKFINILKLESSTFEKQSKENRQQQKLDYYNKIYDIARSLFLIVKMLENQDILRRFEKRFRKIEEIKVQSQELWRFKDQMFKLQYKPLFLHEHFARIALLTKQEGLTFTLLIKYMLANRDYFLQNAYFYQSITENSSTPYLETDASDLIENIVFHLPLMKKGEYFQQSEFKVTKDLLYKMTGAVLKLKNYPFMKYMIQQNVLYRQFSLAIMIVFSQCFHVPGNYELTDSMKDEHLFVIKSLILCNRIDLAHMYVLDHHNSDIFQEFIDLARINGNTPEILELKSKDFILEGDHKRLKELLQTEEEKWSILFSEDHSEVIMNEEGVKL